MYTDEPAFDRAALPVLVVDDDDEPRALMHRVLERGGYKVAQVANADAALSALTGAEHGVLVTDFRMPGMDGVELLARVRKAWPEVERILVTGAADVDVLERGVNEAQISRYLKKPWSPPALMAVVDEAQRAAVLRRENRVLLAQLRHRSEELEYLSGLLRDRGRQAQAGTVGQRWDSAMQAISDPVAVVGPGLVLQGANLAAAALAGRAPADLEGRRCHEALFHRKTPCAGCPLSSGAGQVTSPDSARVFDARAYALPGTPGTHLCFYRDVTRDATLLREAAELDKMAAVARVAAGVAHEINNPLHGILSFAQLATRPELTTEKRVRYLDNIREAALRCRDIVQSMRELSRQRAVAGENVFDLRRMIDRALIPFATELGSRLERRLGSREPAPCLGNPRRMEQVVINLVQNAIDASPPAGHIAISLEEEGDLWLIAVDDQGPGVPAAMRARVFEPFYTSKVEGAGTGLGLAISHTILREHRGSLRVVDGTMGGARFEARLPRAHEEADDGS